MTDTFDKQTPLVTGEPDHDFLEPAKIRLFEDGLGHVNLTISDERSYPDVRIVRAFPLSEPDRFIGIMNRTQKVIGLIEDPSALDESSAAIVESFLARHYFCPLVTRIHRLKQEFGAVYCDVDTDRGRREFVARGMRDNLEDLGEGRLRMTDVDGNRYYVSDWRTLDEGSRRFLERVL